MTSSFTVYFGYHVLHVQPIGILATEISKRRGNDKKKKSDTCEKCLRRGLRFLADVFLNGVVMF